MTSSMPLSTRRYSLTLIDRDSDITQPSKALISDLFVDSVNLWFTDELLSEINRNHSASKREEARTRSRQFFEVKHHPLLVDSFVAKLKQVLPSRKANQLSDIMHLAKTAASEINIFVTRDRVLLNKAPQIDEAVNVRVLSPTGLIVKLRELSETQPYVPDYVAGPGLSWRRLTFEEFLGLSIRPLSPTWRTPQRTPNESRFTSFGHP